MEERLKFAFGFTILIVNEKHYDLFDIHKYFVILNHNSNKCLMSHVRRTFIFLLDIRSLK